MAGIFSLNPKLAKDTYAICQLGLSDVLLMNDSRWPWLILVPRVVNACEWFDLSMPQQAQLHQEVMHVAMHLKQWTNATKMNIAALGNQVPQLHVHVIARSLKDPAWPNPVWGCGQAVEYTPNALENTRKYLSSLNITNL